jgi:hemerythrin superfamily protein
VPDTDALGVDGRAEGGSSPTGRTLDVVDVLLVQHARIEDLFTLVAGTAGEQRREAFDDLVRMLAAHETAEEEVVHPLSRGLSNGGDALVDDRLAEERQAKEMLVALDESGPDADGFDEALLLLRNAVLTHARYEERYEFPQLRAKVPADRLRSAATAVRAAEAVAPTRPHPGTESAAANLIAGPALAVADRARDLIRAAVRKHEG